MISEPPVLTTLPAIVKVANSTAAANANLGVPLLVAKASATSQTSTVTNAVNFTTPSDGIIHAYRLELMLIVNSVTGGSVQPSYSFVDPENNTVTTTGTSKTITGTFAGNFSGSIGITASAMKPNTAITLTLTAAATINFDYYAYLSQID